LLTAPPLLLALLLLLLLLALLLLKCVRTSAGVRGTAEGVWAKMLRSTWRGKRAEAMGSPRAASRPRRSWGLVAHASSASTTCVASYHIVRFRSFSTFRKKKGFMGLGSAVLQVEKRDPWD
jgi:hypothetical protein